MIVVRKLLANAEQHAMSTTLFDFADEVNRFCFFLEVKARSCGEERRSQGNLEASFLTFLTLGSMKQSNTHTVQGSG